MEEMDATGREVARREALAKQRAGQYEAWRSRLRNQQEQIKADLNPEPEPQPVADEWSVEALFAYAKEADQPADGLADTELVDDDEEPEPGAIPGNGTIDLTSFEQLMGVDPR